MERSHGDLLWSVKYVSALVEAKHVLNVTVGHLVIRRHLWVGMGESSGLG